MVTNNPVPERGGDRVFHQPAKIGALAHGSREPHFTIAKNRNRLWADRHIDFAGWKTAMRQRERERP